MSGRELELWGGIAAFAVCLLVGVPVLLEGGVGWAWWACYLGYLAGVLSVYALPEESPALPAAVVALALLGAGTVALTGAAGFTAVLLVVTTGVSAYSVAPRWTFALIAAQSALIGFVAQGAGAPLVQATLVAVLYTGLQVCTVLGIWTHQRELRARTELAAAHAELAEAHAELRAASAAMADASRTAERLRIARDLHDVVGHQLTALALELEVAGHRATPPAATHVANARRIARDLLADVRAAVGELRDPAVPLRMALEEVAADLPRPWVHVEVADDVEVDPARATALVRCAQELATNAARHAGAEHLWIRVEAVDGRTVLRARDDGRGAAEIRLGNGLQGMRERLEQLGGAVTFDPGPGFAVVAEVPTP